MAGFRLQVELEYKSVCASSIFCPVECGIFYNMTFITAGTSMSMTTTKYFSNDLCFTKYFGINTYDLLSLQHPGKFHEGLEKWEVSNLTSKYLDHII